jgi:cyclophilin family peptidyl-prolyl cis-trans isomerase
MYIMKKILALISVITALTLSGCANQSEDTAEETAKAPAATEQAPVHVTMETSMGTIKLELYPDKAPKSVENFLSYANEGHYDGTIYHRVISNFMIQGGGFTPEMQQKPVHTPIENEAGNGLLNTRGTVAMARTGDPHSATSQFFINVVDNAFLNFKNPQGKDWGYAVFGKVTEGMDVVDKIRQTPTGMSGRFRDVPKTPVIINKVTITDK